MPNFQAISRERHAKKRWQGYSSYLFAVAEPVIALAAAELPKATMSLPIGFMEQAERFVPVAVLGLQPGKNLFVTSEGRWAGDYIPAAFRSYPFHLARTEDGQQLLCIDEDSSLITDGPAGESFFGEDGQPSRTVLDIMDFLNQTEQSRLAAAAACAVLQEHNLIRPWPISLKTEAGEKPIAGLFQVDEAALNTVSGEALLELRQAGALPLAYCQLLAMQHLPRLVQLAEAQALAAQRLAPGCDLDLEFLNQGGTISFGGLG